MLRTAIDSLLRPTSWVRKSVRSVRVDKSELLEFAVAAVHFRASESERLGGTFLHVRSYGMFSPIYSFHSSIDRLRHTRSHISSAAADHRGHLRITPSSL